LRKAARFAIWGAVVGVGGSLVLVLLFWITREPLIPRFFASVDKLAFIAATYATEWFFPGDLLHRGVSKPAFFDAVLLLVTGLQCAFLGLGVGLLLKPYGRSERK
jgi:hypothetical protein